MGRTPEELIRENISLAVHTTIGLGGPARFFAHCETIDELRDLLRHARSRQLRFMIIGGGSNIIFPDRGFDGLVIRIGMKGCRFGNTPDGVLIEAAAGEPWDRLVQESVNRGLTGIECLSGIPGLVGATPMQNVGAYGQEVADTVQTVEALDLGSMRLVEMGKAECRFGYRQSRFKGPDREKFVITRVTFLLKPEVSPNIRYPELRKKVEARETGPITPAVVRETVLSLRRGKSMVIDPADSNSRSVGSFFMNPVVEREFFIDMRERWHFEGNLQEIPSFPEGETEGVKIPAAWLVENSGFHKGYRKGGAGISSNHALALVNHGGTTTELLALAGEIKAAVKRRFSIDLHVEPDIVD